MRRRRQRWVYRRAVTREVGRYYCGGRGGEERRAVGGLPRGRTDHALRRWEVSAASAAPRRLSFPARPSIPTRGKPLLYAKS